MEEKNKKKFKYSFIKTGAVLALTATILSNLIGCGGRLESVTAPYDQPTKPSVTITETYTGTNPIYGTTGESNNSYFYIDKASLNQVVSSDDLYFYPSKNNDNADRRLTQGEYESMIISVTGADYNEFVSLVNNKNVVYKYADLYQVDEALEFQERYANEKAQQSSMYTDLICDIHEIPSVEMIKNVIKVNSTEYLQSHKGYSSMPESEIDSIATLLHQMVELNHDKINDNELRRIYSLLKDISVVGIDSYDFNINDLMKPYNARVTEDGVVMIDLDTLTQNIKVENGKERTYEHEIYHLFQRMCPDAQIEEYYQIGPSQYFDNLEINSLHWNWLYEASAEKKSTDHFEATKPIVYKNMVGYLKSLDLITLIRPEYEQTAIEDSTLVVDENYIYELLGAKTLEEKKEVINLLYSIDYLQNNREDFETAYKSSTGMTSILNENIRDSIKIEMKNSIMISLSKIFYRNLAERVKNTDVPIQDIFYLINAFEEDVSYHTDYDERTNDYQNMMSDYIEIQNAFFNMLAGNDKAVFQEIVETFNNYSMAIKTDEGLRRNCELSWLTDKERTFIFEQMVTGNISYMTTNIRNTK